MRAEFLLVSDLDDTLLGDPAALVRFGQYFQEIRQQVDIVYASGRFFASVLEDIKTTPLPEPLAVIGGVGSEIRKFPEGALNQGWVRQISSHWSASTVRQLMAEEHELRLQPDEFQSDYKVSYFFHGATSEQLHRLRAKLWDAGIRVNLIYSSNRDLDFLPQGADKGTAAAFVAEEFGFPRNRVLVAGNSGNDAQLLEQQFYGIIVSNAHEELKQKAGDRSVYVSDYPRADGVRDGLMHWIRELNGRR